MKVGLIDVDGHHFPNLALMRISAYHKQQGDEVEWWLGDLFHYDLVYMSKVFSNEYSPDVPDPLNADRIIKGGTGYRIKLENGKETYTKGENETLPSEVEKMFPDYTIYPQFKFAVSMTTRGCPRGCEFCHVAAKEGRCSIKVADVKDFWNGQSEIKILDANITACRDKRDLFRQYIETNAWLDFTQGLDIRLLNDDDLSDLKKMKLKMLHFAWDNPKEDLGKKFNKVAEILKIKPQNSSVYVLTNFNSSLEEDLWRIYTLRDLGYSPYVMIYDKPNASSEKKKLQRWVNNKIIFNSCNRFEDYQRGCKIEDSGSLC